MSMFRFVRSLFVAVPLASVVFGCAASHESTTGTSEDLAAETTDAVKGALPAPADASQRLYFDANQSIYLSDTSPLSYWVFGAKGGHEFKLAAAAVQSDGTTVDPAAGVGFKLYYLYRGHWTLYRKADGVDGSAVVKVNATYDHVYMVEVGSATKPQSISLHVGCAGGDHAACAVAQEPGDRCGGLAAAHFKCDDGLYCDFSGKACGAGDQQGACAKAPQFCSMIYKPVCGCDGNTYSSACVASSRKVSVSHDGACDSPACDWQPATVTEMNLDAAPWKTVSGIFTYVFDSEGNVTATDDVCANSTCKVAIREKTGTVTITAPNHLTLNYTDGTVGHLDVQKGCPDSSTKKVGYKERLVGDDWGTTGLIVNLQ